MDDWATISALATAGGTLALAIATFVSVLSANRSARVADGRTFLIDVQYTNDEGDQRAVTRFVVAPTQGDGAQWLCSVGRHIYLDRPNPR